MRNLKVYFILILIISIYACNSKIESKSEVKSNAVVKDVIKKIKNSSNTALSEPIKEKKYGDTILNKKKSENKNIQTKKEAFVESLKNGKSLSTYFSSKWSLIYHENNRCDGATDGKITNLTNLQIDTFIKVEVRNDGDGWACDKTAPKSYVFDFDLKQQVKDWNRFEFVDYKNQEKNIEYILGAGESDYLKLYYNDYNLISKLEYRSEDPG